MFENTSSSEWLMYISEWTTGGAELSNIRVTTKVAVNALLGDTPALRDYGTAIMHNLGTKEVKAVVCIQYTCFKKYIFINTWENDVLKLGV